MKELREKLSFWSVLVLIVIIVTSFVITSCDSIANWGNSSDTNPSASIDNKTILTTSKTIIITTTTDTSDYADLFNQYRQDNGLKPLSFTDDLNEVAKLRLEELKTNFSHSSQEGYNQHLAENIVMGISSDRQALSVWDNSSGHRANMLNSSYTYTGYASGGGYAVQLFTSYPTVNGEPQLPPGWHWTD